MAPSTVLCLSLIGFLAVANCSKVNLFGADPSGGLWGARVDLMGASEATSRRSSGYNAQVFDKLINTASFDTVTKKVLFHTVNPAALYYGPLCAANRKSPRFLTNMGEIPVRDPELGDCVSCATSGFVTHNGVIYFLLYGDYMPHNQIARIVEIRSFVPCEECKETGKKLKKDFTYLDVVTCSKVEVTVIREVFSFDQYDDKTVKAAKSMKIVPEGGKLSFFFQLGNIMHFDNKHDKVNMSLWYADTEGMVKELHTGKNIWHWCTVSRVALF